MVALIGSKLSWVKLEEALKRDQRLIALLPVGSFEQHGHHLPLSTDSMVAWHIASAVEERIPERTVLFPPIVYACSSEHRGFPGTLWVDYQVFIEYARCVVDSLFESGFRSVAAINAHGGNVQALGVLQRMVNLRRDFAGKLYVFNLTDFREATSRVFERSVGVHHAGYFETSMVEHICPQCVDHQALRSMRAEDFKTSSSQVFAVYPTREVTKIGVVDDSEPFEAGDPVRGRKIIEEIVEELVKRLEVL